MPSIGIQPCCKRRNVLYIVNSVLDRVFLKQARQKLRTFYSQTGNKNGEIDIKLLQNSKGIAQILGFLTRVLEKYLDLKWWKDGGKIDGGKMVERWWKDGEIRFCVNI